jgi:spore cortex formation protein SpoVR/YcgB (stage V sporulation)
MTFLPAEVQELEDLTAKRAVEPLFATSEWDFDMLRRTYDAIEEIALDDLGLDVYPNQIEVISTEQMLDAYSSIGMPLMYKHWSFGKHFARDEAMYRKGFAGLAYEIVINSNPCISYNMEDNTMTMQALVMAHAAFGHNHFFKNNYLFKQWTDADGILDYLQFAKNFIIGCEERHGVTAVEEILDAAHALMDQGVFRYQRRPRLNLREQAERETERRQYQERTFNDLWRTVPKSSNDGAEVPDEELEERKRKLKLPEENLLYFLEKNSPVLEPWQREILRIVRNIGQYFYPQKQTKVMNEGCATFVHFYIMNRLYETGQITEGTMLEILHNHSNVVFQPEFDDQRYNGINPYALGFAMMEDIKRICTEPTAEDEEWFPEIRSEEHTSELQSH